MLFLQPGPRPGNPAGTDGAVGAPPGLRAKAKKTSAAGVPQPLRALIRRRYALRSRPMSRTHHLSITTLILIAAGPLAWLACGESKPPQTAADESASASADSSEAADSDGATPADTAAAATEEPAATPPAKAAAKPAAAPPPAAPPLGGTDCGKCIDKTCAKQAAACGKNSDCQSTLDSIHSCASDKGASACVEAATPPTEPKPMKLAKAYETCAKKATNKACKAKCQ
jgi:hypothetical protein